jgi:hypothetical protein
MKLVDEIAALAKKYLDECGDAEGLAQEMLRLVERHLFTNDVILKCAYPLTNQPSFSKHPSARQLRAHVMRVRDVRIILETAWQAKDIAGGESEADS